MTDDGRGEITAEGATFTMAYKDFPLETEAAAISKPSIVVILGMHRSGTSCLAGSLQQRGLHLGSVFTSNRYNAKGNRENAEIMQLNESVLNGSGGGWDRPPATLTWTREQSERRNAIIEAGLESGGGNWGFKDPRTLLTLAFWQEAPFGMRFAGTFRHPVLVARSLEARNSMPLAEGLSLWRRHNELLLRLHRATGFPLVSFDVSPDEYASAVGKVAEYLRLPPRDASADEPPFMDDRLRHQETLTMELSADLTDLYDRLLDGHRQWAATTR